MRLPVVQNSNNGNTYGLVKTPKCNIFVLYTYPKNEFTIAMQKLFDRVEVGKCIYEHTLKVFYEVRAV